MLQLKLSKMVHYKNWNQDTGLTGLKQDGHCWYVKGKGKGIQFRVLYPPKRSHDLPPLAGLYTRKPFQSPGGYSRATGSI